MSKSKPRSARDKTMASELPADWTLEDFEALMRAKRDAPISRAYRKFYDFVNDCVHDPDFRHDDSRALLLFLTGARDSLLDGITSEWALSDIVQPIINDITANARNGKNGPLNKAKDFAIGKWLSIERKRGEKEGFCLEVQAKVSLIAERNIAIKTIRDNWLSAKSIESWRKETEK